MLAKEPGTARAQRRAHRGLPLSRLRAGEQEVREVGAGNGEHEADHSHEHEEHRAHLPHEALVHGGKWEGDLAVRLGMLALQPGGERVHLRLRLGEGDTGTQAREDLEDPERPVLLLLGSGRERRLEGEPEQEPSVRELELRPHHAHDLVRSAVETEGLPEHAGVRSEPPRPQPVRQDHDLPALVVGHEGPSESGAAEEREEALRHDGPHDLLGAPFPARGLAEREEVRGPNRHVVEGMDGGSEVLEVGKGEAGGDEAVRIGIGERPEQDSVDEAEHRGVGADAEGEGRDRHRGEEGVAAELPQGVAQVLDEDVHAVSAFRNSCQGLGAIWQADAAQGVAALGRGSSVPHLSASGTPSSHPRVVRLEGYREGGGEPAASGRRDRQTEGSRRQRSVLPLLAGGREESDDAQGDA